MIIDDAIEVLKTEAQSILGLIDRIDDSFTGLVDKICASSGRVVVGGIGKSGIIGQKIVATMNSTGTRALFLHPVEAMHGDLGIVSRDDIFIAISNSGETEELNCLIPSIQDLGCVVAAFTGNPRSTLARHADFVIHTGVTKEACPLGLAPTSSTTAQLAMGDALAVALIKKKKFRTMDFKRNHPGGQLGQRLSKNIRDIMATGKEIPMVRKDASMKEAILEMDRPGLGFTLIVTEEKKLCGIITDGDIRRGLAGGKSILEQSIFEFMTPNPLTIDPDAPAYDALYLMEHHQITVFPVTTSDQRVIGILHLHDILGKGAFKFNGL